MEKREGNIANFFKRKARGSSTSSETLSPERARIRVDQGSPEEGEDIVDSTLNMAQEMGEKLDLILKKLAKLEDIDQKVEEINERFKKEVHRLDLEVKRVEQKTRKMKDGIDFMEKQFENVRKLQREETTKMKEELQSLERKLINLKVYQRRENLVFYGIEEKEFAEGREDTTEAILKDFLDDELEMPLARCVKFQRVHRLGKPKENGNPRPIIVRFLNYPDVAEIMKRRKSLSKDSAFGIRQDLPKRVSELRKQQSPRMVEARKEGKHAFFSKAEPYRLIIDGRYVS